MHSNTFSVLIARIGPFEFGATYSVRTSVLALFTLPETCLSSTSPSLTARYIYSETECSTPLHTAHGYTPWL